MASINKVILIGNIGKDPNLITTNAGTDICSFPLATTFKRKDSNGDYKDETTWHNIVTFGKTAQIADKYLAKGSPLYVEGRLSNRKYTGKDGIERWVTEVIVENMQMLGSKKDSEGQQAPSRPVPKSQPQPQSSQVDDEDCPF